MPKLEQSMRFLRFYWLYLRLTELHQLQNIAFQAIVFGSGVGEDVDKGSGQRNLQSFLYGSDAHLWAVATTLRDRITYHHTVRVENLPLIYLMKNGRGETLCLVYKLAKWRYFQIKLVQSQMCCKLLKRISKYFGVLIIIMFYIMQHS